MHPQLQAIITDFEVATAKLEQLLRDMPASAWRERPAADSWSAAECVGHLNRTGEEFLPLIRAALSAAPRLPAGRVARYRRDFLGWMLWKLMPPPVRLVKSRTTAPFLPTGALDPASLAETFRRLQAEQIRCVEAGDGLALDGAFVTSPFDSRARYNLYACLGILPRHQHRHLWQAEQAIRRVQAGGPRGRR